MDSSKLNQLLELADRLANSPAMKAAEQAASQLHESQALAPPPANNPDLSPIVTVDRASVPAG